MSSKDHLEKYLGRVRVLVWVTAALSVSLFFMAVVLVNRADNRQVASTAIVIGQSRGEEANWHAPDVSSIRDEKARERVTYGRELIAHTSYYLGPTGSVTHSSNGMNCQNCHLEAGTKPFGNNYAAVASSYPKFRARSGSVESIEKRVNDCFERSLNGTPLDTASEEMTAIVSYIKFVGSNVEASGIPAGAGMKKIQFLDRAADPVKGKMVYEMRCVACHGQNGEGVMMENGHEYQFPPLWGPHSYNIGAGLYRLSNFAQFIHSNMPLGATSENPVLSTEEAWDIAAYVNSLPRPDKDLSRDWPTLETKPFDHPFGPFADQYGEDQHKYGPFKDIQKSNSKKRNR